MINFLYKPTEVDRAAQASHSLSEEQIAAISLQLQEQRREAAITRVGMPATTLSAVKPESDGETRMDRNEGLVV